MPKLKLKTPKSRPAKSARAASGRNTSNPSEYDEHHSTLIGLTDPFSSEAATARYPDQGAGRSLTFQTRVAFALTTDGTGAGYFAFNPKVNFSRLAPSSATGNTVTWGSTWVDDQSSNLVNTYGRSYRPTSCGIRLTNVLSATSTSGMLIIAKGGRPPALPSGTTFIPSNFASWDVHSMVQGGEWHALSLPRSSNGYDFKDVTTTNANNSSGDDTWETIYVGVQGSAASGTALYAEYFINFEYTAQEDAVIAQLAVAQPVMNVSMQTAVNHVQSNMPPSHRGSTAIVSSFLKKETKKALVKHVIPFLAKKGVALLA